MFLPIKVILDRRPRKDGSSPISIQYCHCSDKRTVLPTGIAVSSRYWNKRLRRIAKDLPAEFGQVELLNHQLQKTVRFVEDLVPFTLEQKMEDSIAFLKKAGRPNLDAVSLASRAKELAVAPAEEPTVNLDFFYQLDDYIKTKKGKSAPAWYGLNRCYLPHCLRNSGFVQDRPVSAPTVGPVPEYVCPGLLHRASVLRLQCH